MRSQAQQFFSNPGDRQVWIKRWSFRILLVASLLILFATLYPFDFSFGGGNPLRHVAQAVNNRTNRFDLLANVVLFIPFGFSVAGFLPRLRFQWVTQLLIVLGISASLSSSVEVLQAFLPGRTTSAMDALTNTLGGGIGGLLFLGWGVSLLSLGSSLSDRLSQLLDRLALWHLVVAFFGYLLISFMSIIGLQTSTLTTWNPNYPLVLGSNQILTQPWNGSISNLMIADRAVSQAEAQQLFAGKPVFQPGQILAAYPVKGTRGLTDQTGNSPNLVWRGSSPPSLPTQQDLAPNRWLETAQPPTALIQAIQSRSEFTISATIVAKDRSGSEFAPFISIAANPYEHNLLIGQVGQLLLFWLRTSSSGQYSSPDGYIGGIFTDANPIQFVMTFAGATLRLYSDRSPTPYRFDLTSINFKVLSRGLIFVPLGVLLALIAARLKMQLPVYLLLLGSGVLLPPILLETMLMISSGRSINRANLLLGSLILFSALIILRNNSTRKQSRTST